MAALTDRPATDEYSPFYAGYVALVPPGDLIAMLATQLPATRRLAEAIGEARAGEPYAPGKWSTKDVVEHLSDVERVMAYRLLRIARGDATPLASFDHDEYVRAAQASARPLARLLDELTAVRGATVALLASLDAEALARRGVASGHPVSARAIACIIAGHEAHHVRLLRGAFPEIATANAEGMLDAGGAPGVPSPS